MPRKLTAFVHLTDENGVVCSYGPDDTVPEWAAAQITNPSAWADAPAGGGDGAARPADPEPAPPEPTAEPEPDEVDEGQGELEADDEAESDGEPVELGAPPPKGGPGSGRDAWVAYAERAGFEVEDTDGRDDIIAVLEANDVPTDSTEG